MSARLNDTRFIVEIYGTSDIPPLFARKMYWTFHVAFYYGPFRECKLKAKLVPIRLPTC